MPIPPYVQGYPEDGQSLGASKLQIRSNLDGTFQTLAIDHIDNNGNPGANPAGYHKVIHQVTQGSDPAAIVGVNQVYSKIASIPSGDTQLFSRTGNGGISQLTGSSGIANGFCWCSGILLQWGTIAATNTSPTVTFSPAFPTNLFNVQVTRQHTPPPIGTPTNNFWVATGGFSRTGFTITNGDGNIWSYYWFAIGN